MFGFDLALVLQIFVLINPLSSFPFLISANARKMNVRVIAVKSVMAAFILAVIITLIGPYLFSVFRIRIDSFRIAGGIVLLLLGIATVRPKPREYDVKEGVGSLVTVIATPMLTGPATISFIIIKAHEIGAQVVLFNLIWAFALVLVIFFIFSLLVTRINSKIVGMVSRVLGLFLTAVAVEMMAKGIEGLLAGHKLLLT